MSIIIIIIIIIISSLLRGLDPTCCLIGQRIDLHSADDRLEFGCNTDYPKVYSSFIKSFHANAATLFQSRR
jgi:hypothetical protein